MVEAAVVQIVGIQLKVAHEGQALHQQTCDSMSALFSTLVIVHVKILSLPQPLPRLWWHGMALSA